jgi:NRAMP (natural resistance-associated macrophage protein)-like metal ion transporter
VAAHQVLRRFVRLLGPGFVTGAADDDPSGIATYSIAGAQFGTALLWTALVTWPLMAAVQAMCSRIGMVTGGGLASALRARFPRPILIVAALALLAANTFNIGADLAGMADAAQLLTRVSSRVWIAGFGCAIGAATVQLRYATLANTLKWLALVLLTYVVAAVDLKPDWGAVAYATFIPSLQRAPQFWATLVAILGTTISPYLFFWQASQEVEEEKADGRITVAQRQGATRREIVDRRIDVGVGAFFSNGVMFFIILTTALTLHAHGMRVPGTSREVAEALRPVAGRLAELLYTIGLVGTGALAIPVLSGSAAYALSETFGWRQGIDAKPTGAHHFYIVVTLSIAVGMMMDLARVNVLKALYWSAVLNGLLAPFLLLGILVVASDRALMRGQPSARLGLVTVGLTTAAMFAAAVAMFVA